MTNWIVSLIVHLTKYMLNDLLEESVDGMTMDNSSNGAVDGLRDGAQEEN